MERVRIYNMVYLQTSMGNILLAELGSATNKNSS